MMREDSKRKLTLAIVVIGWTGTVAISLLTLAGWLDPTSRAARMGALFIVVALWGGIARSRYILSDTIVSVFSTAYAAGARSTRQEPDGEIKITETEDSG